MNLRWVPGMKIQPSDRQKIRTTLQKCLAALQVALLLQLQPVFAMLHWDPIPVDLFASLQVLREPLASNLPTVASVATG